MENRLESLRNREYLRRIQALKKLLKKEINNETDVEILRTYIEEYKSKYNSTPEGKFDSFLKTLLHNL